MDPKDKDKIDDVTPVIPDDGAVEPSEADKLLLEKGYTEQDLSDLSDTEKEGILDSLTGGEEEEKEHGVSEKGEEKPPERIPEAPQEEKPVGMVEPPETPPEETPATLLTDDELLAFKPIILDSEIKVEEQIPEELQTKLEELDNKYEEGEIKLPEYNRERDVINRQIVRTTLQSENGMRDELVWQKTQKEFIRARPDYVGKDADGKFTLKAAALYGALNEAVKRLSDKYDGMKLLIEADKSLRESLGIVAPKTAKVIPIKDTKPAAVDQPSVKDFRTLKDTPQAAVNDTDDPYAAIDKLTGEAYEDALERLSPEQKRRYEDGASIPSRRRA